MKPGPGRTPTALALVRGSKRGAKRAESEPKPPPGLPSAPAFLSADARREWRRIVPLLELCGLVTTIDRSVLAAYCQAYGRMAQAERELAKLRKSSELAGGLLALTSNRNAIQNPLVGIANVAARDMLRYAAEFGMSPSSRADLNADTSRLSPPEKPKATAQAAAPGTGTGGFFPD